MPVGRAFAVALVFVLAAASRAAADDAAAGERANDHEAETVLLEQLRSPDAAVRARAAAEVVSDWQHVEFVARGLADADSGGDAWKAFAEACTTKGRDYLALQLASAARWVPDVHRNRLLELAKRIDPELGVERTAEAMAEELRRLSEKYRNATCLFGYDVGLARLGHGAVPAILAQLRKDGPEGDTSLWATAQMALGWTAQPEDVPALEELLLAGFEFMSWPLATLAKEGVPEAADALLAAVAAGRLDDNLAYALESVPDRARTVKTVRAWIEKQPQVPSWTRVNVAKLYAELAALDTVPDVEAWLAVATKPREFIAFGEALTRLGSRKGVETLVRIVGEPEDETKPTDPSPLVVPPPGGDRMCLHGFDVDERWRAAEALDAVAGRAVFARADPVASPDKRRDESAEARLDRAAVAYRDWWTATKDKLTFDASLRVWIVGQ